MKTLCNYCIVLFLLITANIVQAQTNLIKIGEIINGTAILTYDVEILKDAFEYSWNDGTIVNDVKIEESGQTFNIVAYGTNNGNSRLRGFELNVTMENGHTYLSISNNKVLNSCSGVCCTSCDFTHDTNGKITGCDCNKSCPEGSQAYCEHSIFENGSSVIFDYLNNHGN